GGGTAREEQRIPRSGLRAISSMTESSEMYESHTRHQEQPDTRLMKKIALLVLPLLALSGLCACQPRPATPPASTDVSAAAGVRGGTPDAFLKALYAHYATKGDPFDPKMFRSLSDPAADYFAPELVTLIRDDGRLSGDPVNGLIWGDPVCGCDGHDP